MNIDIRQAVLNNLKGITSKELYEIINSSLGGEEKVLPGLGVLLEEFWKTSSIDEKNHLCTIIASGLKK